MKNSQSIRIFKTKIYPSNTKNPYYTLCPGKQGRWLCRLRLDLSRLNAHHFSYHLTENTYCPTCGDTQETTSHYFFICPSSRGSYVGIIGFRKNFLLVFGIIDFIVSQGRLIRKKYDSSFSFKF